MSGSHVCADLAAQRRRVRQAIPGLAVEADRPARSSGPSRFVPSLGLLLPAEATGAAPHELGPFGAQPEKPAPGTLEKLKRSAKQRITLARCATIFDVVSPCGVPQIAAADFKHRHGRAVPGKCHPCLLIQP